MKTCFVVCPIGDAGSSIRRRSDQLLRHIVKPALEPREFHEPIRADTLASPGIITNQIVELLRDADLVIADLTDGNPNVFYELAARHAFQRPVVHVVQAGQPIPFDVLGARAVLYDLTDPDRIVATIEELGTHLDVALDPDTRHDNPLIAALDAIALRHSADPFSQTLTVIADQVARVREELKTLSHNVGVFERLKMIDKVAETVLEIGRDWSEVARKADTIYDIDDVMSKLDDIET